MNERVILNFGKKNNNNVVKVKLNRTTVLCTLNTKFETLYKTNLN